MKTAISAAYKLVHEAERERESIIASVCPAGTAIYFTLGDREIPAEVLRQSGDRLFVRSMVSGKEFWVGAYRVA